MSDSMDTKTSVTAQGSTAAAPDTTGAGINLDVSAPVTRRVRSDRPAIDPGHSGDDVVFGVDKVSVHYGSNLALTDVSMKIKRREITAFIGPSGCGKSTFLRCFNRTNDLISSAKVGGRIDYHGQDLYAKDVDPVEVRARIGMVFQKPNPFPKSIYDNLAFGPKVNGMKIDMDATVESTLKRVGLWDEVKNKLKDNAYNLSGGQQQRLCIARALMVEPEVILMDEPCSALDPIATAKIEELMHELKGDYTMVIVTHNMQQAARVSDRTAFFTAEVEQEHDVRFGRLIEYGDTTSIFSNPVDPRTEDYISGRFG
ncbi:phosphate ABC transporter ATP-binding protein PstB [Aquipuribacter sp. MA13-6]|uniref:phosphate ABC transporter ATP-binding protein PstB n=1 Tax=unclassified Aquipuribacter TaxID=2635084 RepID=UPI003EEEFA96